MASPDLPKNNGSSSYCCCLAFQIPRKNYPTVAVLTLLHRPKHAEKHRKNVESCKFPSVLSATHPQLFETSQWKDLCLMNACLWMTPCQFGFCKGLFMLEWLLMSNRVCPCNSRQTSHYSATRSSTGSLNQKQ